MGHPAYIAHDPGTNFSAQEFRDNARMMNVEPIQKPVEAHNAIGQVERYHIPLKRAYQIISAEGLGLSKEMKLQMALKAINDTAGPNGLVPTVLVFGAYSRISNSHAPSASIIARATAVKKAMVEVRKCHAARKVADALNMRNGPLTKHLHDLPLGSEVIVYREGRGWDKTPYKLVWMDGETIQVDMNGRYVNFRSTRVKPFLRDPCSIDDQIQPEDIVGQENNREYPPENNAPQPVFQQLRRSQRNLQPKDPGSEPKTSAFINDGIFESPYRDTIEDINLEQVEAFLSEKENRDREFSLELREKGIITAP